MSQELVKGVSIALLIVGSLLLLDVIDRVYDRRYIYISYAEEDKKRVEFAIGVIEKHLKYKLIESYKVSTGNDILLGSVISHAKRLYISRADACVVFLSCNYTKNFDYNYELMLMACSKVIPVFLDCDFDCVQCPSNIRDRKGVFLEGWLM